MIETIRLRLTPICFLAVLGAGLVAVAWAAAVIAISLTTIGLYAVAPVPELIEIHDRAGIAAAALVSVLLTGFALHRATQAD